MPFNNVYHLKEEQIHVVYQAFANAFFEDDLYCAIYHEAKTRAKFLRFYFKHYIKLLAPYCYFLADSSACHSVMIVFDSTKETKSYILRVIWFNIKLLCYVVRLHSMQGLRHFFALGHMFTSCWVNDFVRGEYYHMDLLYTEEAMRGSGLASALMISLLETAKKEKRDVTMETHHKENVDLYEHIGFRHMGTITQEHYEVTQYNLLYRIKEV